ncbi:MAG: hypothetical protein PW788_08110 [Micavibrio sp.]|nr:hypothetical protein [Micavibrio sp.]
MHDVRIIQVAGLILFALIMLALAHFYTVCMPPKKQRDTKPEEVHLRFFANVAFISILVMIAWQLAPWVGYLTVGCIPKLFTYIRWQELAIFDLCALAVGFWKLESCVWKFNVYEKKKMQHLQNTWTPKDTLWMSVFLYLLTIGLAYVSHDVLLKGGTTLYVCTSGEAQRNAVQNNDIGDDTDNPNVQEYQ